MFIEIIQAHVMGSSLPKTGNVWFLAYKEVTVT